MDTPPKKTTLYPTLPLASLQNWKMHVIIFETMKERRRVKNKHVNVGHMKNLGKNRNLAPAPKATKLGILETAVGIVVALPGE